MNTGKARERRRLEEKLQRESRRAKAESKR